MRTVFEEFRGKKTTEAKSAGVFVVASSATFFWLVDVFFVFLLHLFSLFFSFSLSLALWHIPYPIRPFPAPFLLHPPTLRAVQQRKMFYWFRYLYLWWGASRFPAWQLWGHWGSWSRKSGWSSSLTAGVIAAVTQSASRQQKTVWGTFN